MDDKKVFDVTHPQPKNTDASTPRKIMLTDPADDRAGATSAPEVDGEQKVSMATKAKTIQPLTEGLTAEPQAKEKKDTPTIADLEKAGKKDVEQPELVKETNQVEESAEEVQEPEPETNDDSADVAESEQETEDSNSEESLSTPIKESQNIGIALPDDSQRATAAAQETMQEPKIYDTKAYYVPIKANHTHGHVVGALIAGLIAAAAVVAGVYYAGVIL